MTLSNIFVFESINSLTDLKNRLEQDEKWQTTFFAVESIAHRKDIQGHPYENLQGDLYGYYKNIRAQFTIESGTQHIAKRLYRLTFEYLPGGEVQTTDRQMQRLVSVLGGEIVDDSD